MDKQSQVKYFQSFSILNSAFFVLAVIIPYFTYRGLTLNQAIQLVLIYKITLSIFEIPTGVIADRFGHRFSLLCGLIIESISLFALIFINNYTTAIIVYAIGAIAVTLQSGSDLALLHNLSEDYKKDLSNYKSYTLSSFALASAIGGYAFKVGATLPLILTIVAKLLAFTILLAKVNNILETEEEDSTSNIKSILKQTQAIIRNQPQIISLLLVMAFSSSVALLYKYLANVVFELNNLDNTYIGIYVSSLLIISIAGNQLAKNQRFKWYQFYLIGLFLLLFAAFSPPIVGLVTFLLARLFSPVVDVNLTHNLMHFADKKNKSTILSIKNFFIT